MTFMLVSLAQVKQALHIDGSDDDDTLELFIGAASRAVVRYLKGQASDFLAIDSPPDSPPDNLATVTEEVAVSVIMLVGILYKSPDGDEMQAFTVGNLPWQVTALLYPLRDPTLA